MYKLITINNTPVLFAPFAQRQTAALGVFVNIGARYEQHQLKGIAHFLEHMLFKGSKKYSHLQIKQEIEGRGGALNAFTSQEMTAYYAQFIDKNIEKTLDILVDMVFHPLHEPSEIEKERNVIFEEIKMYNDLPTARVGMLLDRLLWPQHPLGEDVIGTHQTVASIKQEHLQSFSQQFYYPDNTIIACCSGIAWEKTEKLLRERISSYAPKVQHKSQEPQTLSGTHITLETKDLQQTHLCLGWRGLSYHDQDRFALGLLNIILGANMSSRLFEEVREKKGLCYDISTDTRKYKDSGAFVVHVGLDKRNSIVALTTILDEFIKIKEQEVDEDELERAKDYFLGQLLFALERPSSTMFYLAESLLTRGSIESYQDLRTILAQVTQQDLLRVARKVFSFSSVCVTGVGAFDPDSTDKIQKCLQHYASQEANNA